MARMGGGRLLVGVVLLLGLLAGGALVAVMAVSGDEGPVAEVEAIEADAGGASPRVRKRVEPPPRRSRGAVLRDVQSEASDAAQQGLDGLAALRKRLAAAKARAAAAHRERVDPDAARFVKTTHPDGSPFRQGRLVKGQRDGLWSERFESGAWIETEYVNGRRHGREAAWNADGRPRFLGGYADDKMQGTWTAWHPNGNVLSTREYVGDQLHGWMRTFHENGALAEESFFVAGVETGVNRGWHKNGQLAWEMFYADGKREGAAIWYDEAGVLFAEGDYVADALHGRYVEYAPDGSVKRTERWDQGRRLAQAQ